MSEEQVTTPPAPEEVYVEVVVFRRADDGSFPVRESARVPNTVEPEAQRIYSVPSWPGDAEAARETAHYIAERLAK